jgi:hypothetical protein
MLLEVLIRLLKVLPAQVAYEAPVCNHLVDYLALSPAFRNAVHNQPKEQIEQDEDRSKRHPVLKP